MKPYRFLLSISILLSLNGCENKLLDELPDRSLVIPTELSDFRALLDNVSIMNANAIPALQILSSDDFVATESGWNSYANVYERNCYIWAADLFADAPIPDWNNFYQQIFYTNIVLDGLSSLSPTESSQVTEIEHTRGRSHFFRGFALFNLSMLFADPYDQITASETLGIPVPLSSNVNDRPGRRTLEYTYERIIGDLKEAENLLPNTSPFKTQPNLISARSALARVYLVMGDYGNAAHYAQLVLDEKPNLIDYNTLNPAAAQPFPTFTAGDNVEIIHYASMQNYSFVRSAGTLINPELYGLYEDDDLRKEIYFDTQNIEAIRLKGNYTGNQILFGGTTVDEMYLVAAESNIRLGNVQEGISQLNTLLLNRFRKIDGASTFTPYDITDGETALAIVLNERRKELVARGLRWSDLRRLNREEEFQVTISRTINGNQYTLLPNSNKYTFPIPNAEIMGSGIEQNER